VIRQMLIDYNEFYQLFLTKTNLQNVICHLCNQGAGLVSDPITETLAVIATTPLAVVITEAGVAMFRDKPMMVFPYSNMNSEQLLYIRSVVDSLLQTSTEGNVKLKGHVQMGGGCIIMIPSPTHQDVIVKNDDLLRGFVESVARSQKYHPWTKKALCSIIMQRLSCAVNLPKDTLHHAVEYSETLFATIGGEA
jgi:hypothetical protein